MEAGAPRESRRLRCDQDEAQVLSAKKMISARRTSKKDEEVDDDEELDFRTPLIIVFVLFCLFSLALYLDCWPCAVTTGMAFLSSIASACF